MDGTYQAPAQDVLSFLGADSMYEKVIRRFMMDEAASRFPERAQSPITTSTRVLRLRADGEPRGEQRGRTG